MHLVVSCFKLVLQGGVGLVVSVRHRVREVGKRNRRSMPHLPVESRSRSNTRNVRVTKRQNKTNKTKQTATHFFFAASNFMATFFVQSSSPKKMKKSLHLCVSGSLKVVIIFVLRKGIRFS